jgi:hypothetical protein
MTHYRILVFFLGEWGIWREGRGTRQEAEKSLAYWQALLSWPLKLEQPV